MLVFSLACSAALLIAAPSPKPDAVLVLGALHDLHAQEPSFDHSVLTSAIASFRPDVLVLEVRPDELQQRSSTPGRPEYPAVVWPLLQSFTGQVVAMEPGGETFSRLSSAAGQALSTYRRNNPEGAAALSTFQAAADAFLLTYWTRAGQSQDATTDSVVRVTSLLRSDLAGPAFAAAQNEWEQYMIERVKEAVTANRHKRVLILASFRNRHVIETGICETASARLADAKTWLDAGKLDPSTSCE